MGELPDICQQRWDSMREWEERFMADPSKDTCIVLKDVWNNWLAEGWARYNSSGEIAGERMMLYEHHITGRISDEEAIEAIRAKPMGKY